MREVDIVYGDKLIPVQLPEPVLTSAAEYGAEKVAAAREFHGKDSAVAFIKYPVLPNRYFISER